jgi:hypothetical protein
VFQQLLDRSLRPLLSSRLLLLFWLAIFHVWDLRMVQECGLSRCVPRREWCEGWRALWVIGFPLEFLCARISHRQHAILLVHSFDRIALFGLGRRAISTAREVDLEIVSPSAFRCVRCCGSRVVGSEWWLYYVCVHPQNIGPWITHAPFVMRPAPSPPAPALPTPVPAAGGCAAK